MKVRLERTGGLAGSRLAVEVDSEELPPERAPELAARVQGAAFFALPAFTVPKRAVRDAFHYRITAEDSDRTKTIEVDDPDLSAQLQHLIDYLVEHARALRLSKGR